jgi:hypothetical protein
MKQSQTDVLFNLLSDGRPHRTDEIVAVVYAAKDGHSLARVGARVNDIKNHPDKYGTVDITGKHDEHNRSLYWYTMRRVAPPVLFADARTPETLLMAEKAKQGSLI